MKSKRPPEDTLDPKLLLAALSAVRKGDFSTRLPDDRLGLAGKIHDAFNEVVERNAHLAAELARINAAVGKEGRIHHRAQLAGATGGWLACVEAVNSLIADLVQPTAEVARVIGAVAKGDLSLKMALELDDRPLQGEFLRTAEVVNTMVEQLSSFASEVTRVAREVGTEGKLGGQADVKGVSGTWKDLTDGVNLMASNLTAQVRNIAEVTTAVANGDLSKKITVDVKGEIAELKNTINVMVDQLSSFTSEVTRVAREVGTDGKLGAQAKVTGVAGTWRDLTDNVNQLAANLTTQVRAIAEVATAVTKGDLTRSISVGAQGEVATLKDNINQMIANLRETTQKNAEQDWLKTNLARFTRMLQGQRDLEAVAQLILRELAPLVAAQQGVFYILDEAPGGALLKLLSSYAYRERKNLSNQFKAGEGLVGQCLLEKERILLTEVPGDYIQIGSGLGEAKPLSLVVIPVLFEGQVKAVIELASFYRFNAIHLAFLDQLTESIGIVLNTIAAGMRTEELLKQSQSLASELKIQQSELTETNRRLESQAKTLKASEERLKQQQEELQQTNEELEERSRLLQLQNVEVERKNREIEQAKAALEDRAQQLALSSKYKSEFLANMSHELRTPLNSMLILSKLLADNGDGNLNAKQVEFAHTIHTSGSDLLTLINDILDLSKIESGTVALDIDEVVFDRLSQDFARTFREVAQARQLDFDIQLDRELPKTMYTDARRLQQVLKNLLANAFKFTEKGGVALRIFRAASGWSADNATLERAEAVVAFAVQDTGIGIPKDKQKIIFEAFQQADGTTSRRYGGTGLGLSISREIARLLGGEILLVSEPGQGSTFTLYLPRTHLPSAVKAPVPSPARAPALDAAPAPLEAQRAAGEAEQDLLASNELADDRDDLQPGDRVLLIVEDDLVFAKILLGLARERGFKGLVAVRGDAALAMARRYRPDAVTLDIGLPGIDGWSVLDRLKHDPRTRHVPVHIITGGEESARRGLQLGAIAHLKKPVTREALGEALANVKQFIERPVKNLLVVEDDPGQRMGIVGLIGDGDVKTTAVATGVEALGAIRQTRFDCLVLDLGLPDMTGLELIEELRAEGRQDLPVIVYTGKELTEDEETALKRVSEAILVKSAKSPEQLLDETTLFLHRVEARLPERKRQMIRQVALEDPVLARRKVLIVDDDVRNIFALTSVLERYHMEVLFAENGRKGIELIRSAPDLDVVLMDVMMPEMDGFEAMRAVRQIPELRELPIIALTAKAMRGDREKCIEAGASDYIPKPVDTEQLVSLLRVWLYRAKEQPRSAARAPEPARV